MTQDEYVDKVWLWCCGKGEKPRYHEVTFPSIKFERSWYLGYNMGQSEPEPEEPVIPEIIHLGPPTNSGRELEFADGKRVKVSNDDISRYGCAQDAAIKKYQSGTFHEPGLGDALPDPEVTGC